MYRTSHQTQPGISHTSPWCGHGYSRGGYSQVGKKLNIKIKIRHHAKPKRASATAHRKKKKKTNRASRQTQPGISHSAPTHRGGHVQNRSRRREQRRGTHRTDPQAEQLRVDGRPSRKVKACQHGRGRRQPRARRRGHTKQECHDKSQAVQLHAPRGGTSQRSSRVEEERDKTSRGSHNGGTIRRKCCQ